MEAASGVGVGGGRARSPFMEEFFGKVDQIKRNMDKIKKNMITLEKKHGPNLGLAADTRVDSRRCAPPYDHTSI